MSALTVTVFEGEQGFIQIREQWLKLAKQSGTHFTHYPFWYESNIKHYPDYSLTCFFVGIYRAEQLVCVLPLEEVTTKFGFKYIQLFYPNEMGVCDIVWDGTTKIEWKTVVKQLIKLKTGRLFVRLQSVLDDSHAKRSGLCEHSVLRKLSHQPAFLTFPNTYDEFFSSYSKKFTRNIRRLKNKAAAEGELSVRCVREANALDAAFEQFLDLENSGWKGESGSSLKKIPALRAYYQHFLDYYGENGSAQINLLYSGDKPIAGHFAFNINKTVFLLKIGYEETLSSISPGQLLIDQLIEYGTTTGEFDQIHFVTAYNWMDRWKPSLQSSHLYYLPTGNPLGLLLLKALKLKNQWQARKQSQSQD